MKYLVILGIFFLASCTQELVEIGCGDKKNTVFTVQDSTWLPNINKSLFYKKSDSTILEFKVEDYRIDNDNDGSCIRPIQLSVDYISNSSRLQRIFIGVSRGEYNNGYHQIFYSFSIYEDTQIPFVAQSMGIIDIEDNQPINTETTQYVETTKLGTHELNGKTYNNVFVVEDLKESEVPQIDIFRFYVNPSGILRIEFYDGEIWDRID